VSFLDILKSATDAVDGGVASVVMGFDGISVEKYFNDSSTIDVETLGIEYSSALAEVRRTADSVKTGAVEEVAVVTDRAVVLLKPVNSNYFIALVLKPDGNFGKGRYLLGRAARAIAAEM
jgi:predicted regulator of Ras-like GTPase activity (Roadblock/LC7/MglB family)